MVSAGGNGLTKSLVTPVVVAKKGKNVTLIANVAEKIDLKSLWHSL